LGGECKNSDTVPGLDTCTDDEKWAYQDIKDNDNTEDDALTRSADEERSYDLGLSGPSRTARRRLLS
jgi:hypothetical protein